MNHGRPFGLLLFSTDPAFIRVARAAGVDAFVVDWEHRGKADRQAGADTEINRHGAAELRRVRAATEAPVLCRINGPGVTTADEIELAITAGADEILVPMIRSPADVELILRQVDGRCGVGILIETSDAVRYAESLGVLPLARVYVGLNDLVIDRCSATIFDAISDGTVEQLRPWFPMPFGFGGLTLPDAGSPIPCRLLIAEMRRLECQFSFLRRSFHRDIQGRDPAIEIPHLREALRQATRRDDERIARDQIALAAAIHAWAEAKTGGLLPLSRG